MLLADEEGLARNSAADPARDLRLSRPLEVLADAESCRATMCVVATPGPPRPLLPLVGARSSKSNANAASAAAVWPGLADVRGGSVALFASCLLAGR